METFKRTRTCGDLRKKDAGSTVILNGWIHRIREHGGITFINLRDRYGITQVVVDADSSEQLRACAKDLRMEFCIAVEGEVRARPDSMVNADMGTGEIEVVARTLVVLSKSAVLKATYWRVSRRLRPKHATLPAVCRAWPNCLKPASRKMPACWPK